MPCDFCLDDERDVDSLLGQVVHKPNNVKCAEWPGCDYLFSLTVLLQAWRDADEMLLRWRSERKKRLSY